MPDGRDRYSRLFSQDYYNAIAEENATKEIMTEHFVARHSTVGRSLHDAGIGEDTVSKILAAAREDKLLERFPANGKFNVHWQADESGDVTRVVFFRTPTQTLVFRPAADESWSIQEETRSEEVRVVSFQGRVDSTLWASATAANMGAGLINAMAEVFAWQIDFSREIQKGDRWRLAAEQRLVDGKPIGWGNILACEYAGASDQLTAVRFPVKGDHAAYYAPDGSNMHRLFLKAPIRFARITSRFSSMRFHPILKIGRPHLGVDYGAPTGTPVMAVGRGRVTFAAFSGGSGRAIRLRHNEIYQTEYKHLSRFASGLKAGAVVEQGEVIGYVGATGLATAPHLHYSFYENGRYVDPLSRKFPSADPIREGDRPAFTETTQAALALLPELED